MIKEKILKSKFEDKTIEIVNKNITILSILGLVILVFFIFSDLYLRHSVPLSYTRILPTSLLTLILILRLLSYKNKIILAKLFNITLASIPVMIYSMFFIYVKTDTFGEIIIASILVIFLISLVLRTKTLNALAIYFVPFLVFIVLFIFVEDLSKKELLEIINIIPMLLTGFIANRIYNNQQYKTFKANYFLNLEKIKTEKLFDETIELNSKFKQQNLKLNEQNSKLKQANAEKDKFFSIIAHDLKSPFTSILGFSNILKEEHKKCNEEKREEMINLVNNSASRAFKLLENLLTWARSQSGQFNFSPEILHLKILLFETVYNLQEQANKKNIQIINKISENDLIFADENMIAVVFRNLISNAIKFTNTNGSIIITYNKQINSNVIEISVSDTGVGIPKDKINDLFYIGKNISTQGTENETGTGLGLLLCKEFIEKHSGNIRVKSEVDKGSEFIISIPCKS